MSNKQASLSIVLLSLSLPLFLMCQWSDDPANSLHVRNWGGLFTIESDGNGGVFVIFGTYCSEGHHWCVYLDRLDKWGYLMWDDPIPITGEGDAVEWPQLIPDGEGGVLCAYYDKTFIEYIPPVMVYDYKLRINRYDSLGTALWEQGVIVSTDTLNHRYPFYMISDDENGCFVSWKGYNAESADYGSRRSMQHISSNGERLWGNTGILLQEENHGSNIITYPIYEDGNGGFFLDYFIDIWDSSYYRQYDHYGNLEWEIPQRIRGNIIADGTGGLMVAGPNRDEQTNIRSLKIDKINSFGEYAWGEPILLADSIMNNSKIIGFDYGDDSITTIYWKNHYTPDYNSYFQRVTYDGQKLFEGYGIEPFDFNSSGIALVNSNNDFWSNRQKWLLFSQILIDYLDLSVAL